MKTSTTKALKGCKKKTEDIKLGKDLPCWSSK